MPHVAAILRPAALRFSVPAEWVSSDKYIRAYEIIKKKDKMIKMIRRPGEGPVYYILSQSQTAYKAVACQHIVYISKHTIVYYVQTATYHTTTFIQRRIDSILYDIIAKQEITAALISKYEELRAGTLPTGVSWGKKGKKGKKGTSSTLSTKQQLFNIKNSMYRLKKTDGQFVCPCDANPYNIQCRVCKSFAHDGICKHCLALTHLLMADKSSDRDPTCNFRLMAMPMSRRKKAGRRVGATPGLVLQPPDARDDSSDEEQDLATAIMEGTEW